MKLLSYIALIGAGVCLVIALLARFFFNSRIIFHFVNYLTAVEICLLASIAFALLYIIQLKSK